jgi:uncharacterized protein YndB with AHSA1/START domain
MGFRTMLSGAAALALMAGGAQAQSIKDYPEVVDSSSVEPDGGKVLQLAVVIPVERSRVWRQFTTTEGYKAWAVPVGAVDFRLGGVIEGSYDYHARLGDPNNIKNKIIAYVPGRMLAIQNVQAPVELPGRKEFGEIVTTMAFEDAGPGATRVTLTAVGYKPGEPYDTLYRHFGWGNAYTLMKLKESLVKGPIDWKAAEAREQAQAAARKVTEAH